MAVKRKGLFGRAYDKLVNGLDNTWAVASGNDGRSFDYAPMHNTYQEGYMKHDSDANAVRSKADRFVVYPQTASQSLGFTVTKDSLSYNSIDSEARQFARDAIKEFIDKQEKPEAFKIEFRKAGSQDFQLVFPKRMRNKVINDFTGFLDAKGVMQKPAHDPLEAPLWNKDIDRTGTKKLLMEEPIALVPEAVEEPKNGARPKPAWTDRSSAKSSEVQLADRVEQILDAHANLADRDPHAQSLFNQLRAEVQSARQPETQIAV